MTSFWQHRVLKEGWKHFHFSLQRGKQSLLSCCYQLSSNHQKALEFKSPSDKLRWLQILLRPKQHLLNINSFQKFKQPKQLQIGKAFHFHSTLKSINHKFKQRCGCREIRRMKLLGSQAPAAVPAWAAGHLLGSPAPKWPPAALPRDEGRRPPGLSSYEDTLPSQAQARFPGPCERAQVPDQKENSCRTCKCLTEGPSRGFSQPGLSSSEPVCSGSQSGTPRTNRPHRDLGRTGSCARTQIRL